MNSPIVLKNYHILQSSMYWGIATTVWWSLYRERTEYKDDFFTAEELETSRLTLDFMSNYIEEDEDEVRHMVVSVEGTDSCNMYQLILLPNPEVFHFGGEGEPNLDLVFVLVSKRRLWEITFVFTTGFGIHAATVVLHRPWEGHGLRGIGFPVRVHGRDILLIIPCFKRRCRLCRVQVFT